MTRDEYLQRSTEFAAREIWRFTVTTKTDSIWAAAEHLLRRDAAVPLQITAPPNIEGETQLIVRWLVETPAGRVGAWNRAALEYLLGSIPAQAAPTAALPEQDRAALASAAPQPAVQQWNDLIAKETHADADGLLVWRDEVDFAIPTVQAAPQQQELLAEIQRLQRALAFWLPQVPSEDHPLQERIAHDAFLLAGYYGPDEPSAYELGHVALAGTAAPVAHGDARVQGLIAAADYIDGPASGYAAEHSYTEPSPMAKVAAALRQKAEQEDAAYQARRSDQGLMESEWGPMEDAPPHEDPPMHVAVVEGDDAVRTLQWNRDVAAFAYPVGTLLYAARSQAKEGA